MNEVLVGGVDDGIDCEVRDVACGGPYLHVGDFLTRLSLGQLRLTDFKGDD